MSEQKPPSQEALYQNLERTRKAIEETQQHQSIFSKETFVELIEALHARLHQQQEALNNSSNPATESQSPQDTVRLATVMFIDVKDSTEIASKVGHENWRIIIGETHRLLATQIEVWGGEVGQYLGDGLLCFFGAMRSRGNDALRAVSCALVLQEMMIDYSQDLLMRYSNSIDEFAVRIGISTGQVVVGTIGTAEKSETLAIGATTNLAARLQAICPPHSVVVDEETYHYTRADFTYDAQAPVQIKGFQGLIPYYQVLSQRSQVASQLTSTHIGQIAIPFLGRDAELTRVLDHLQNQPFNGLRSMLLVADIGLGKSRFLQEVSQNKQIQKQYFVVRMIAHYERQDMAFGLLRDTLYTLCNLSETQITLSATEQRIVDFTKEHWQSPQAEAAASIVGNLAGYGFTNSPYALSLSASSINGDNQLTFGWVRSWLNGIANGRPLLIVADNLQWADKTSLALLESFREQDEPVFLLAAARPEFRDQAPLFMHRVSSHQEQMLHALSEQATRQLLNTLLSDVESVPPDLIPEILERAEGNPLFVEEFVRRLFDTGVFEQDGQRWRVNRLRYLSEKSDLPKGLIGMLQARLDDLMGPARRVVQIASVVGQTFWLGALNAIHGGDVSPVVEELVTRKIILERSESRFENDREFVFRNSLYHSVAYSMLTRHYKTSYHKQVAEWLAGRTSLHPQELPRLAEHYANAGMHLESLRTYVAAAEYQLESGRYAETAQIAQTSQQVSAHLERSIALPYVSMLWLLKARAAHAKQRYGETAADSSTALRLLQELPPDTYITERVQASVVLGGALAAQGIYEEAIEALTQAYQILDEQQHTNETAMLLRAFGQLFWMRGNLEEAQLYQDRAMDYARKSGKRRSMASTAAILGRILTDRGDLYGALRYYQDVITINRAENNYHYQVEDLLVFADIYRQVFAYDLALNGIAEAESIAERINYQSPRLSVTKGLIYLMLDNPQDALQYLEHAVRADYPSAHMRYHTHLALVRGLAQIGDYEQALNIADSFVNDAKSHSPVIYGRTLLWQGLSLLKLNRPHALRTLRWALDNEITYGGRDVWMCHFALSIAYGQGVDADTHRRRAEAILQGRALTFAQYPYLQQLIQDPLNSSRVFVNWLSPAPIA